MNTKRFFLIILCISISAAVFTSCKKDKLIVTPIQKYGKVVFKFDHKVSGQPLVVDTLLYVNAAGNPYKVVNIQYFLSDFTLHNANGASYSITQDNDIHYIDTDIPSTSTWSVTDNIPAGSYSSVSVTFGIDSIKNKSHMFLNPPESNMFWPDMMGGGYHYMKMNGEWIDSISHTEAFNFHLGIGQVYDPVHTDSVIKFVQNYFTVTLPASFVIDSAGSKEIEIVMNIDSWFDTPHVWDWNKIGGMFMQKQNYQQMAKDNGEDGVFTIGYIH